ncbi:hypothetical protein OPV22_010872 [Ensete ventricosum]|uniref:Uncharacterized protein n=1 Tax=Ensete ventricosum TaxID=4639 RepID=A0AAV8PVQ1_ENSVE|nr:hypothetical protein OPV22_010872 [Ensete ventricosum]
MVQDLDQLLNQKYILGSTRGSSGLLSRLKQHTYMVQDLDQLLNQKYILGLGSTRASSGFLSRLKQHTYVVQDLDQLLNQKYILGLGSTRASSANPSPPERSCEPVISAAFRFPQSPSVRLLSYCPTIMICYAVSGREGEEPAGGPSNPWGSRMRTNEVAGNRLWDVPASVVRMMPDLLGYEQKDAITFVLWERNNQSCSGEIR